MLHELQELLLSEGESTEYCLNVHNRKVAKVLPDAWTALPSSSNRNTKGAPKLRSLDLSFNALKHIEFNAFATLAELRELKLYSNKIDDEVRSLVACVQVCSVCKVSVHSRSSCALRGVRVCRACRCAAWSGWCGWNA